MTQYRILDATGKVVVATCDDTNLVRTLDNLPYLTTGGYNVQVVPAPTDEERIQTYLDDHTPTYDADFGSIETCIRIIGMRDPSDAARDERLVDEAMRSLASWLGDYGVEIEGFEVHAAKVVDAGWR